jgi:predicted permease
VFGRIIGNPLILGSGGGALLLLLRVRFPEPFSTVIDQVGGAGIPLILLCVGAGLNFHAIAQAPYKMALGTFLRLIVGPLCMALAAHLWGITGLAKAVMIGCGATPTAASAYILAREMGGDAKLMAGLVTATTLFSAFTIPLMLGWLAH